MSNIFNLFPDTDYSGYIVPSGRVTWSFSENLLDYDNMNLTIKPEEPQKKIQEGEIWYVKLPGQGAALAKMQVNKLYQKVVELRSEVIASSTPYKLSDVEFVEKVS